MHTSDMLTLKRIDWGKVHMGPGSGLGAIRAVKFQGLKCLEHGLEVGERTWTVSGHVPLALWPLCSPFAGER